SSLRGAVDGIFGRRDACYGPARQLTARRRGLNGDQSTMLSRFVVLTTAAMALGLSAAQAQNFMLPPAHGEAKLASGGLPYSVTVTAGGVQDAAKFGLGCVGFVSN